MDRNFYHTFIAVAVLGGDYNGDDIRTVMRCRLPFVLCSIGKIYNFQLEINKEPSANGVYNYFQKQGDE
ncbi:hypothetical protein BLOT_001209 [Blomia tropicalis]|nr:hypothetical protein BLOT_001209 [Blomia tropicalis]